MVQAGVVREEGRMPKEPGRPDVAEVKQALPFALVSSQEESSGSGVGGQGGQEGEEERNSVHFTEWKQAGNGNSTRKKKETCLMARTNSDGSKKNASILDIIY